ncbi:MAG TPA: hypothetical protein VF755_11090 [Catenuloplanes sp.]
MRFFSDPPEKTDTNPAPTQRQASDPMDPEPQSGSGYPPAAPSDARSTDDDPRSTTAGHHGDTFDDPTDRGADADRAEPQPSGAVAEPFFGTDAERTVAERADDQQAEHRDDDFAFHEPAPQPTAFGAGTVGGAVAASAMAGVDRDEARRGDGDGRPDTDPDGADDRPGANHPGAGRTDDADAASGDTAGGLADTGREPHSAKHDTSDAPAAHSDRTDRTDTGPDQTGPDQTGPDQTGPDQTGPDQTGSDSPAVESAGFFGGGDTAIGTAPVATSQLPGTAPLAAMAPLFADDQTHQIRDRWRDVQLRFIDDPRGAAEEASGLIDEAVDTLTTALREQKQRLGTAGTDTEELRILIRSYRDFLDHLLEM